MSSSVIALCCVAFAGCKDYPIYPDQPLEYLTGIVTNEDGVALEGIMMSAYLPSGEVYIYGSCDTVYTNKEGRYYFSEVSHQLTEPLLLNVIAEDTLGIYEKQQKQGKIEYADAVIGYRTGSGHLDFVLKKIVK